MRIRTALVAISLAALAATAFHPVGAASAADPEGTVRGSVNQLSVLDATPGAHVELLDADSAVVGTGTVDEQGSFLWRELDPGTYAVREDGVSLGTGDVTDFAGPAPAQSLYDDQTLSEGFNYITTRDGTTLSANVTFPSGAMPAGGYPTVVEYSGYDPSNPANTTMATLFNTLGYAYVGVNVRGTGCSGGAFMTFEPIQSVDGYDTIETVAAQSWVAGKVGMVGISYPGIEQLYVARTEPPHLAAITPLSVIDDTYRGTLYPGGILNTGFAVPWAQERADQAEPYGQQWAKDRADAGDTVCAENQRVRLQNVDLGTMIDQNPTYDPAVLDQINPSLWVKDINVPVFLAGAWQDEQTGGHFPNFLDDFAPGVPVYATMTNGSHAESLSLGIFGRYADFLDLYVGKRVPGSAKQFVAPVLSQSITGVSGLSLPKQIDYTGLSYQQALAKYEAQKPVRILFEEGAAAGQPSGSPLPRFEKSFSAWPIESAKPTAWYLGKRRLRNHPVDSSVADGVRRYSADPSALPATDFPDPDANIWAAHPTYDWQQIPKGKGLGWISAPLKKTMVSIGSGSLDVWIRTPDADDTDLEATISEVRPNGTEVYVQSGWLRASHRKLDAAESTVTNPVHTDLAADQAPLPAGQFTKVRLALFPFAQPFRKGSRIRITLDAPGGARPLWAFDTTIAHGETVQVAADRKHPSRLVLPIVPGVKVPAKAPACASLRSQPCRTYP
ncbi:CocE/NonD family hydrolase [Nocardioides mangrovi]|uniref:CocE/NonD family hydrolase n=1 Tax=Nocardioides mangrovi TaxID=2874580 RepID=A0ABS7U7B0_9ACTN|nr:CocE/NonD family hydrolase [Nocardioides mangrovi]MBZ5736641.1 CocE/NonD family hydrolase [Nocardioides mangrovi]